ncbi:hypothetical protein FRC00_004675 [Tulasnella sp. 408]|nr:hypothetical protein FRC00_004675 [Tulasnella sp. 408]
MDFQSTFHRGPNAAPTQADSDQVLTVQAARWLLETTSNRGDQISTAQFMCSLDQATCAAVFDDYDSWRRLLNLTLGAFEICCSQPNKENQEVVELFGLVVCLAILHCPKEDDKWTDLAEESLGESNRVGKAFLQTLVLTSGTYPSSTPADDELILHISLIHAALKEGVDVKEYVWLKSCSLLGSPSDIATALLRVWAILINQISRINNNWWLLGSISSFERLMSDQ